MEHLCDCDYVFDSEDQYTLPEFHQKYKDKLPLLVVVSGGFNGKTTYDEVSTNQVIWFHRVCKQTRVLGRLSNQAVRDYEEFVSIPVHSSHMFTVFTSSRHESDPETLEDILTKHKLPVLVRLASEANDYTLRTVKRYTILLIKTYTETFLQGNCLQDDILLPPPLLLAISPDISVAIATGYVKKPKDAFNRKLRQISEFVKRNVELKEKEGCKEITLFDKQDSTTGTGNSIPPDLLPSYDEDFIYQDIVPDSNWIPPIPPNPGTRPSLPARPQDGVLYQEDIPVESENHSRDLSTGSVNNLTVYDDDESGYNSSAGSIKSYVSDMSVEDIQSLLEALNLTKYKKDFRKHLIDGAMLEVLEETILREDFKFKHVEVIRLKKFIREGYMPKQ
ncbi:Hypothetical predicted protein [Mytilus galloprovincialis]|uniref:SAM domain-containing protein n=1 Tax=Mytilus galloprovincialis TaxID=29158 RepID=A0A8B6H563_MYTGA|nr:Hypothetical predicted protein [Mytilus galloprovincialis]